VLLGTASLGSLLGTLLGTLLGATLLGARTSLLLVFTFACLTATASLAANNCCHSGHYNK